MAKAGNEVREAGGKRLDSMGGRRKSNLVR